MKRLRSRRRPFQADNVFDPGQTIDHAERQARRGPERVVDDDADAGRRLGSGHDELLEIAARWKIEPARDLACTHGKAA